MRGLSAYRKVSHHTASQSELVLLSYESAIKYQYLAVEALEEGDRNEARRLLRLTREIFGELLGALDHEPSPELSGRLARLYVWMITELGQAGTRLQPDRISGCLKVSENLLEGWRHALGGE